MENAKRLETRLILGRRCRLFREFHITWLNRSFAIYFMNNPTSKIMDAGQARAFRDRLQAEGKRVAFTNGCFDILHRGHVTYLQFARDQADALCLGLNSDASVKRNKGENRPINSEADRAFVMASLAVVDCVVIFDENEPRDLIAAILPQVLIKGRDWAHYVSGRDVVEANGGTVVLADMVEGKSTTGTIEKVLSVYGNTIKP